MHGAGSPRVRAAAKRRRDEEKARAIVGRLLHDSDAEPITDPFSELLRLGGVLRNAADVAGERLNALEALRFTDDKGAEQIRGEVVLWRELITLAGRTLADIAKLDIAAQAVRLEEAKLALVAHALDAALAPLDEDTAWTVRSSFVAALGSGDE